MKGVPADDETPDLTSETTGTKNDTIGRADLQLLIP